MKVFRENGYFMLILANGHHGVLQSFVKHLSVAVIFLQSCPLARAISRRRKKIWKRSLSLVSSHHRRRFKLTCRKRSAAVAFDKSRHQQSTKYRMIVVDRHFNKIEKYVPYPVFPSSSDHFHFWRFSKKVRSIHVSICFIITHNETILKMGSNGCVRILFGNRSR